MIIEERVNKKLNKVIYFVLFLYLCATVAHQTWVGFDALICKATFLIYSILIIIKILKNNKLFINEYIFWFVLFFFYIALSCLWSNDIKDATAYFTNYFLRIFILIIGLSNTIEDKKDIHKVLKIYILSIFYMIIVLLIKTPAQDWGTYKIGQAIGLWKNSVGLYLAYAVFILVYFYSIENSKKRKIINLFLIIFLIFLIVISGSRKALLMVPLGIIFYIYLNREKKLNKKNLLKRIFIVPIIFIIIYFSSMLIMKNEFFYNAIGERIESGINVFLNDGEEQSLDERNYYIDKAKQLFMENPIIGYGSNGFVTYMKEINYPHVAYCHNNFFEILSTLGIIGFIIYYYMHIRIIYLIIKNLKRNQKNKLFSIELSIFCIITLFGWWNVYYFELINNFIFIIIYMSLIVEQKNTNK